MAMLCADEYPNVDINKVIKMCLIHDFGEAITGDIPAFLKIPLSASIAFDRSNAMLALSGIFKFSAKNITLFRSGLFLSFF